MPFHVLASASAKIIRKESAQQTQKKEGKKFKKLCSLFMHTLGLHHHVTLSPFMFNTN